MSFKYKKPNESPGLLLWNVHTLWQRAINQVLKPFHLTHTQFVIMAITLWFLNKHHTPTQIEIAKQSKIDPVVLSNAIKSLEKKHLIKRKEAPDTRAKNILLTKKGASLIPLAIKAIETFDTKFFECLEPKSTLINDINTLINKHESIHK
jgi:MarR family transcriptional regulator, organic hydroperoxide resistance regulator